MENESNKPGESKPSDAKSSDAAAISARIVALQGDSDEYAYAEPPPKPAATIVSGKAKRRRGFNTALGAVVIFLVGGFVGTRLEKKRAHPPVAVVNGEAITAEDFAHASEIPAGRTALQRLIDDKLSEQYAKKIGVYPDPKEVSAKFTEATRSPDFFQNLKRANQSQDDYKYNLLITMCKQAIVSNGIKVNPSEIKAYYDRNIDRNNKRARFFHPETVQAAVIVTQNRESIEAAKKDLASNIPWAVVVQKYSADESKSRNGILPPLRRGAISSNKYPNLEKVMFDLQNGNTSDITQIDNNYWIIRCLNHTPETIDPFDKVQEQSTTGLLVERGIKDNGADIKKKEQDFVKASTITITLEQYSDVSPKR